LKMKRDLFNEKSLTIFCALSLAAYLCFSTGLRFWLSSWGYFRALYVGISSLPDGILVQWWKRTFFGLSWDLRLLGALAGLLALSFLIAWLAWRLLGGRTSFLLSISLFVPACLMVPQTLLASIHWPDGRGRVTYANHMAILGLVATGMIVYWLILIWRGRSPTQRIDEPGGSIGIWGIAFLIPAALVVATAFIAGIGNSPGYDSGAYHMPLAASYGVSGSLETTRDITSSYPANGELVLRWFLFPGNDRFGSLPSIAALLLIAGLLYKLCRALEIERQSALIAACTTITFPVLPHLAVTPNPDLIGISAMLAALLLLPAFLFIVVAVVIVFGRGKGNLIDGTKPVMSKHWLIRTLLPLGFGALIGGGFWFVRNLLVHGNPLYPVSFMGLPGLPLDVISPVVGIMKDKPWLILTYPWTEVGYTYIYDTGIGAVFTAIVLPGLIWWPMSMIRNWRDEKHRLGFERIVVFSCVIFCGLYFLSRPCVYTRHAAFAIVLSFFLVAEMWRRYRGLLFRVVVLSSFILMCFSLEKSLTGAILYRLAIPAYQGAERFGLPTAIDKLPPSRIFNATTGFLNYGCMGVDYRHKVETLFAFATPQDIVQSKADYLVIRENQKARFENGLRLELVSSVAASDAGESISLYRILPSSQ
jgi:hypothetical protein